MFKIISDSHIKNKIYVDMMITDSWDQIVSDIEIRDPISMSKKYRLSEDAKSDWSDFLTSVISVIRGRHFDIIRQYQSSKSYSYYVDFYPVTLDGQKLDEVELIFRFSDHRHKNAVGEFQTEDFMFRSFEVNGQRYKSTYDVMMAVRHICEDLQKGDYSTVYVY